MRRLELKRKMIVTTGLSADPAADPTAKEQWHMAVHYSSSAAYCPWAVSMCIAAAPLPAAQRQCGDQL